LCASPLSPLQSHPRERLKRWNEREKLKCAIKKDKKSRKSLGWGRTKRRKIVLNGSENEYIITHIKIFGMR
jgi:hypothetical protein